MGFCCHVSGDKLSSGVVKEKTFDFPFEITTEGTKNDRHYTQYMQFISYL